MVKAMTVDAVGVVPARPAERDLSALPAPRTLRFFAQAATLVAVGAAETLQGSLVATYLTAQAVVVLGALVLLRVGSADGLGRRACSALVQGVVLSAVAVPALVAMGVGVRSAQLVVVAALGILWGLSRMRAAYVSAGSQLDAILATLPEPATEPERAESSHR